MVLHATFTIHIVAMGYGLSKLDPSHLNFNPWAWAVLIGLRLCLWPFSIASGSQGVMWIKLSCKGSLLSLLTSTVFLYY